MNRRDLFKRAAVAAVSAPAIAEAAVEEIVEADKPFWPPGNGRDIARQMFEADPERVLRQYRAYDVLTGKSGKASNI